MFTQLLLLLVKDPKGLAGNNRAMLITFLLACLGFVVTNFLPLLRDKIILLGIILLGLIIGYCTGNGTVVSICYGSCVGTFLALTGKIFEGRQKRTPK